VHIAEGNVAPDQAAQEQVGPELAGIVSRLRRAMRRAARAADPHLGLSVAQLELLSCITEHPGIRPSQLARMLRLAPSSVATLLGGLQSAGYVTRTPGGDGAGDRRTVSLDLSEAGAAAVTRWYQVNEDIIQAALAALPHRDRAALRDAAPALRDLTASIDAQADLAGPATSMIVNSFGPYLAQTAHDHETRSGATRRPERAEAPRRERNRASASGSGSKRERARSG
jgi:DNA-binding MarR family transcriptional regulator